MTLEPATVIGGLLSPVLVFLAVVIPWRGVLSTRDNLYQDLLLPPWAMVTAVLWHPGLLRGLPGTIASSAITPLVGIVFMASLALFALSIVKTRALRGRFMRRATVAPAAADLVSTTFLAVLAIALASPLLHAARRGPLPESAPEPVLEGLALIERLRSLAVPAASDSLIDQAAALLLWSLLIACLLGWLIDVRRRRRSLGAMQAGVVTAGFATLWWLLALALG